MIRIISGIAFIISILCVGIGIVAWVSTNNSVDQARPYLEALQNAYPDLSFTKNLDELHRNRVLRHGAVTFVGLIGLIIASGLWFKKEWARIAWLAMVTFLVLSYWLLGEPWGAEFTPGDWWSTSLITLIGVMSWIYLTKRKTREMFREHSS